MAEVSRSPFSICVSGHSSASGSSMCSAGQRFRRRRTAITWPAGRVRGELIGGLEHFRQLQHQARAILAELSSAPAWISASSARG
jgi:hypothetical protein